jgi:hypothetical protein
MFEKHMKLLLITISLLLSLFPLNSFGIEPAQELKWDEMVPAEYSAEKMLEKLSAIKDLDRDDPRSQQMQKELEKFWDESPIVESLDGKRVKLPGFVVPLEGDGRAISEFLLVPAGACIHVPPPPANQAVYVKIPEDDTQAHNVFDAVWGVGIMSAKPFTTDFATAGYQIKAEKIIPYE